MNKKKIYDEIKTHLQSNDAWNLRLELQNNLNLIGDHIPTGFQKDNEYLNIGFEAKASDFLWSPNIEIEDLEPEKLFEGPTIKCSTTFNVHGRLTIHERPTEKEYFTCDIQLKLSLFVLALSNPARDNIFINRGVTLTRIENSVT